MAKDAAIAVAVIAAGVFVGEIAKTLLALFMLSIGQDGIYLLL
jgi:hypothetical protein